MHLFFFLVLETGNLRLIESQNWQHLLTRWLQWCWSQMKKKSSFEHLFSTVVSKSVIKRIKKQFFFFFFWLFRGRLPQFFWTLSGTQSLVSKIRNCIAVAIGVQVYVIIRISWYYSISNILMFKCIILIKGIIKVWITELNYFIDCVKINHVKELCCWSGGLKRMLLLFNPQ